MSKVFSPVYVGVLLRRNSMGALVGERIAVATPNQAAYDWVTGGYVTSFRRPYLLRETGDFCMVTNDILSRYLDKLTDQGYRVVTVDDRRPEKYPDGVVSKKTRRKRTRRNGKRVSRSKYVMTGNNAAGDDKQPKQKNYVKWGDNPDGPNTRTISVGAGHTVQVRYK